MRSGPTSWGPLHRNVHGGLVGHCGALALRGSWAVWSLPRPRKALPVLGRVSGSRPLCSA